MGSIFTENTPRHMNLLGFVAALTFLLIAPAALAAQAVATDKESIPRDFAALEGIWAELEDESRPLGRILDRVFKVDRFVRYAPGKKLFVTEYFTVRTLLRRPARAAIFLTGPEFRGNFVDIPVEGYSGPVMAAQRGFFAYTVDYVGVGLSLHLFCHRFVGAPFTLAEQSTLASTTRLD